MFLETYLVLFGFFVIFFIVGQITKNNSIMDVGWGAGFVVSAIYTFFRGGEMGLKGLIITIAISVWGLRLTYHIAKRNLGKPEDYRYVDMRKKWGNKYVLLKAFFHIYFLQFLIQAIVTIPIIYGNTIEKQNLMLINWFGVALWGIGFFFESFGDYQLKKFIKNPVNKGHLMDKGLWSITRHPNYFGDSAMWFGIFLIVISNISDVWIVVGPVLMTYLLVFVSGVRLQEKKYASRDDFKEYKKITSVFIPWFPKKRK